MDPSQDYDLLIVGSGASGAGVAIEAASRGLKCAVIDKNDFASGTSSRSTKLAHGGIRYFEQMMMLQGDPVESYNLLYEALNERNYFLQVAPYQNSPIKLLIPEKSAFWTLLWYYPAVVLYHLLYMKSSFNATITERIPGPKFLWKARVRQLFPDASSLHGFNGALMHEGQMIDSRMCVNSLLTASIDKFHPGQRGATLANYVQLQTLLKGENGKITGAVLKDNISGKEFQVKAKAVVNCTGAFADDVRRLDNPEAEGKIIASRGTHLIFKSGMLPANTGFIVPKTNDGRLLFALNYLGHIMVGTTDEKCGVTHNCEPSQQEIDFII